MHRHEKYKKLNYFEKSNNRFLELLFQGSDQKIYFSE